MLEHVKENFERQMGKAGVFLNPRDSARTGISTPSATKLILGWPELPSNLIPEEADFHEPISLLL